MTVNQELISDDTVNDYLTVNGVWDEGKLQLLPQQLQMEVRATISYDSDRMKWSEQGLGNQTVKEVYERWRRNC